MKRSVLLSLTGITLQTFVFLITVQASSQLRDIPHGGGANIVESARPAFEVPPERLQAGEQNSFVETFDGADYRATCATTAHWSSGRMTAPMSGIDYISSCTVGGHLTGAFPNGDLVYVGTDSGFAVLDISNPETPHTIGTYVPNVSAGKKAVLQIAFQGNFAYAMASEAGLQIVNVSDPRNPVFVGMLTPPYAYLIDRVLVSGNVVYLGGATGLVVADITTPEHPSVLAEYRAVGTIRNLFLFGDTLVVASEAHLTAFDITDPTHVLVLSQIRVPSARAAGYHNGNILVACDTTFWIVDVTTPSDLRLIRAYGYYPGSYIAFDETEGILYQPWWFGLVAAYDVHDPGEYVFEADGPWEIRGPRNVSVGEDYLFASFDDGTLAIATKVKANIAEPNIAQSIPVDDGTADIERVRMTTQQLGVINWYVSTDGAHWEPIQPDNSWVTLPRPGSDLMWRAELMHAGGVRSSCGRIEFHWEAGPPRQRPGPIIVVKPDGSGDVATIRDALLVSLPGDTILLGPGVFTGSGNRSIHVKSPCIIRSIAGPERTIIDCEGSCYGFAFGEWYPGDYALSEERPPDREDRPSRGGVWGEPYTVEGITIRNVGGNRWYSAAIYSDYERCIVRNCVISDIGGCGVYVDWNDIEMSNSIVERCEAVGVGVAGTFTDCRIRFNGDGIWAGEWSATLTRCSVTDNTGTGIWGGTVYATDCDISRNGRGGVIAMNGAASIVDCRIQDNTGDILWADSFYGVLVLQDNVITNNAGSIGFGVPYGCGQNEFCANIVGNTFCNNGVADRALMQVYAITASIDRNIFAYNVSPDLLSLDYATVDWTRNDVFPYGGSDSSLVDTARGNFSADPWFCSLADSEYTLQEGSPCLPENNPSDVLIGALGQGCEVVRPEYTLSPTTLGVRSQGVVTASVRGVAGLDVTTARLQSLVPPLSNESQGGSTDRSSGATGRKEFKFSAQALLDVLLPVVPGEARAVTFTARLEDGRVARASTDIRIAMGVVVPPSQQVVEAGDILVGASRYGKGGVLILVKGDDGEQFLVAEPDRTLGYGSLAFHGNDLLILSSQKRILQQESPDKESFVLCPWVPLPTPAHMDVNGNTIVVASRTDSRDIVAVDAQTGEATVLYTSDFLLRARDVAVTREGIVYVAHATPYEDRSGIIRIDPHTGERSFVGDYSSIYALALDEDDNLFASEGWNPVIYRIDPSGAKVPLVSDQMIRGTRRFEFERDGGLMVASYPNRIVRVSPDRSSATVLARLDVDEVYDIAIVPPGGYHGHLGKDGPTLTTIQDVQPPVTPGIASVIPNPFNPTTRIRFGMTRPGPVDLTVYDVAGRVVERLVHGTMPTGNHEVTWNASGVASGVYFARLVTAQGEDSYKLVVMK